VPKLESFAYIFVTYIMGLASDS